MTTSLPRGASTVDRQTVECERVGVVKRGGTERPGVCAAGSECVQELTLRSGPQAGRGSHAGWLSGPPRIGTRPVLISYRRKHWSGDSLGSGVGCICSPWSAGRGQAWEEARVPSDCSLLPDVSLVHVYDGAWSVRRVPSARPQRASCGRAFPHPPRNSGSVGYVGGVYQAIRPL